MQACPTFCLPAKIRPRDGVHEDAVPGKEVLSVEQKSNETKGMSGHVHDLQFVNPNAKELVRGDCFVVDGGGQLVSVVRTKLTREPVVYL